MLAGDPKTEQTETRRYDAAVWSQNNFKASENCEKEHFSPTVRPCSRVHQNSKFGQIVLIVLTVVIIAWLVQLLSIDLLFIV